MSDDQPASPVKSAPPRAPQGRINDSFKSLVRPAFAEWLGSALFVYVACGCGINAAASFQFTDAAVLAIAFCFGMMIFVLAFTFGHISGAHLNPVVSVTFFLMRKISFMRAAMYVLAQFLGTLVGMIFLRATTPTEKYGTGCFAANFVSEGITAGEAFLSEVILTAALLLTVCAATDSNKSNQTLVPLAIGLCVTICHLMSLPITGTSLNPTRSFASAALASNVPECQWVWASHWVFWFGPFLGGILGAVLYEYVFHDGGSKLAGLMSMYRKK